MTITQATTELFGELNAQAIKAQQAYYAGEPIMPDDEYDAILDRMEALADEALARWPLDGILIHHRTGLMRPGAAIVVLDSELGRDLMSFGVPLLVLGDPAQLPPIQPCIVPSAVMIALAPQSLTPEQAALLQRRPWFIRVHRRINRPYLAVRRRLMGRLRDSGRLLPEGSK